MFCFIVIILTNTTFRYEKKNDLLVIRILQNLIFKCKHLILKIQWLPYFFQKVSC